MAVMKNVTFKCRPVSQLVGCDSELATFCSVIVMIELQDRKWASVFHFSGIY